ncbi:MAG TPA: hypothetical protein V6C71_01155 [Coleofasciculaceae cyanobacterium]
MPNTVALPPSPCFLKSSQVKPIASDTLNPQPYVRDSIKRLAKLSQRHRAHSSPRT